MKKKSFLVPFLNHFFYSHLKEQKIGDHWRMMDFEIKIWYINLPFSRVDVEHSAASFPTFFPLELKSIKNIKFSQSYFLRVKNSKKKSFKLFFDKFKIFLFFKLFLPFSRPDVECSASFSLFLSLELKPANLCLFTTWANKNFGGKS